MPLQIASLNSGSNANCYYIGNGQDAVLVDAGLSCRETERRMKRLGLEMEMIKAVFISHEHTDHIAGLPVLVKKYKLPVYITNGTIKNSTLAIDKSQVNSFKHEEPVAIGEMNIIPFSKSHDAEDPHSFIIDSHNARVGVITDIGYACRHVKDHFKQCDAVFLESNYCDNMLSNGSYPVSLKKRISGRKGHLSNDQALELFLKHRPDHLQLLILSHLSQNNNDPKLVEKIFSPHAGNTRIVVASRYAESELFTIEKTKQRTPVINKGKKKTENHSQLSLFEF